MKDLIFEKLDFEHRFDLSDLQKCTKHSPVHFPKNYLGVQKGKANACLPSLPTFQTLIFFITRSFPTSWSPDAFLHPNSCHWAAKKKLF
jgi:hypothetical protein